MKSQISNWSKLGRGKRSRKQNEVYIGANTSMLGGINLTLIDNKAGKSCCVRLNEEDVEQIISVYKGKILSTYGESAGLTLDELLISVYKMGLESQNGIVENDEALAVVEIKRHLKIR